MELAGERDDCQVHWIDFKQHRAPQAGGEDGSNASMPESANPKSQRLA
jgi:hypothetical protein